MRYDEDYFYLKDSSRNFYRRFKFVPVCDKDKMYFSFGGEIRYEYAAFKNEDWGRKDVGHNNFLLQRYNLHADFHMGKNIRVFGQLRSALEDGRKTGPRPIDEDKLNVQNLFIDFTFLTTEKENLTLRLGRQELDYGSDRLLSVREGPNVRLYFNGGKAAYVNKLIRADAFVMEADSVYPGAFDNKNSGQVNLWGVYTSLFVPFFNHIDCYYIGKNTNNLIYEEGMYNELRHTIGARIWKQDDGWIYDIEGACQVGKFGTEKIRAYTLSLDIGYKFTKGKTNPIFGIKNDYVSGDKKIGDNKLETFNPLYPKGGYFGFDPQLGAANLIDLHPYGSLHLFADCDFFWDVVFNWRYSLHDGVYRPSGAYNFSGANSTKRYIGSAYLAKIVYQINALLNIDIGGQYFKTGAFIDDAVAGHKNAVLTNYRIVFKF